MRKIKLTREDFIDKWLYRNYNITCNDLIKYYPDESKSGYWFKLFPVTKEEHDLWYNWAIDMIQKEHGCSKKNSYKLFALDYLNCAPNINENNI